MSKGFTCPNCSSDQVGVIQTMPLDAAIQRRRKCFHCSTTFHTYEIRAELIPTTAAFDFLFQKAPS